MTGTTPNPIKRATETKLVVKLGKLDVLMQWNMAAFWASSAGTTWTANKCLFYFKKSFCEKDLEAQKEVNNL